MIRQKHPSTARDHPDPSSQLQLVLDNLVVQLGSSELRLETPCRLCQGRLYLIYGPSGSGKSSFVRTLLGLGELTSPPTPCVATITLTDANGTEHRIWQGTTYYTAAREAIALLPQAQQLGFIDELSTLDNLRLFSRLPRGSAQVEVERMARQLHIATLPQRLARASGGERIRLSAIRGLLPRARNSQLPALIISDEPTAGIDDAAAQALAAELVDLARGSDSIVIVVTHDPQLFVGTGAFLPNETDQAPRARIVEVDLTRDLDRSFRTIGSLCLAHGAHRTTARVRLLSVLSEFLQVLGRVALSPIAFVWGLAHLRWPLAMIGQVMRDACGVGTQLFSMLGCLLMAGTVAYFIFEQIPRPELVQPLLLPEILQVTGHSLVRMIMPLGACTLITMKLGAAQAARLAAAVRGGLLETLALARWSVESYGLVPAVIAQLIAMTLAVATALTGGVFLAALIYVVGHEHASLPIVQDIMLASLEKAGAWPHYLIVKIVASAFIGGTIAALFGLAPATSEGDVARAVHRTLLWSVLGVIGCQCALIIAEFAKR